MSVAHDIDPVEEEKRREQSRRFIRATLLQLQNLRIKTANFEAGDQATWHEARFMAQQVIKEAEGLKLGLLSACAKEVLHFAVKFFSAEPHPPYLKLYMFSALDTLEMELERLRHDQGLR